MSSAADASNRATRIYSNRVDIPGGKVGSKVGGKVGGKVGVYQALYSRRMAWHFKDQPVRRSAIEQMLDAAVWAPNHRLTEPWRFFVLEKGCETRKKVAEQAYELAMERNHNPDRAEAARKSVLDPPVVLYVYCVPGPSEEVTRENYAAVCCAVQNLALAGVAEGLAVTWETGGPTRHPELKETLGAEPDWNLVAMLSIGAPAEAPVSRRTPASSFVRWIGPDQDLKPPEERAA